MLKTYLQRTRRLILALICGAMFALALPVQAVSYSWTNTVADSTGYWTNGILWGQPVSTYPGSAGIDAAYLTNQFSGSAATILDSSLTATISTLAISNALGAAWLIVTNNTAGTGVILTNTTFVMGSGGRLQVDNGGVVTGITSFTWLGNNGAIYLNEGGQLFSGGALTIGNGSSNVNATVSSLSGPGLGGVWSLNNQALTIGTGAATGNSLTITAGANVTNIGAVTIGNSGASRGNGLVIRDGSSFQSGAITIGNAPGASNNYYTVGGSGAAVTVSNGAVNVGKGGGSDNSMVVTNANLWSSGLNIGNNGNALFGATNNSVTVLANTTWNLRGDLATFLVIGSDGLTAISNSLTVNGGVMSNIYWASVGGGTGGGAQNGSYSSLLITNGGVVAMRDSGAGTFNLGFGAGSNNTLTVTGTGSVLKSSAAFSTAFTVGYGSGISNQMTIADGGSVLMRSGTSQVGAFGGSNTVLVTDPGSVWSNALHGGGAGAGYGFGVGSGGTRGNSIIISNSGALVTVGGTGANDGIMIVGGSGGQSNRVIVTGSGSVWSNANVWGSSLYIGSSGGAKYNSVTIEDGGRYFANSPVIVGNSSGANSNSLTLGSAGLASTLTTSNQYGIAAMSIGAAAGASYNTMTITNATLKNQSGGSAGTSYIGNGGSSNRVLVTANGMWDLGGFYAIVIGNGATAHSNSLTVTGGGILTNSGQISLSGVNGALVVSDGGHVVATQLRYSGTNTILVTDPNSTLTGGLASISAGASLVISNQAKVYLTSIYPGYFDTSSTGPNGSILVTGAGSQLTGTALWLGLSSSSNYVTVADNAGLTASYTVLGAGGGGVYYDNELIVTGGAVVTNTGNSGGYAIRMGDTGTVIGDNVLVSNGGKVINLTSGTGLGSSSVNSSNNSVLVTGSGSVFSNGGTVVVGVLGKANSVTVADSAEFFAGNLTVGNGSAATGNQLLVSNATAYVAGVTVGALAGANSNSVLVKDGGVLQATGLTIGAGTTGNTISNRNATYQFTAAPTITSQVPGDIAITDGTISFRATGVANVTNTVANQISKIRFAGANTFQLNNASNTAAAVSQTYTFDTVAGSPSNYVRLVMVNGPTAYANASGADITIGSAGTFLASNTVAAIAGNFTNNGLAEIVAATADFQSGLHVAGTLTLRSGVVTGAGAKTIAGTLRGTGSVVGNTTIAGNLTPGLSIGTLVFSNDLTLTGTYQAEFGDGGNDQLIVVGDLTLAGATLDLTAVGGVTGETYVIASYGNLFGTFSVTNGLPVGYTVDYDYNGNQIAVILIPEPATVGLVGFGLAVLLGIARRRKRV
ncbi:MAG: hypothetical protein PCFJNLEI_00074 [Verrucomicrobiae bacterium]|nr:hypothetical protein [Verrucomicrobiae bacterium]